jgi:hypothetical protein
MADDRLVYEGMRTPWGSAQTARTLAPGIGMVNTAGHGGFKLSREMNARVPDYMRKEGGWYEEDCEVDIVCVVFEQHLREHGPEWLVKGMDENHPGKTIANYWPDMYERYFNRKLTLEESFTLRERAFKAAHVNDYVTIAAWGSGQNSVPDGWVGVFATLGESRQEPAYSQGKYFLVPDAEYGARKGSFVVDPARHPEVGDFTTARTKEVA